MKLTGYMNVTYIRLQVARLYVYACKKWRFILIGSNIDFK